MFTFENLVEGFRELGVNEGDTLLVHSSYKSLGEVEGGPATVVRALEAALGAAGLLDAQVTPEDRPLAALDAALVSGWSGDDRGSATLATWTR